MIYLITAYHVMAYASVIARKTPLAVQIAGPSTSYPREL